MSLLEWIEWWTFFYRAGCPYTANRKLKLAEYICTFVPDNWEVLSRWVTLFEAYWILNMLKNLISSDNFGLEWHKDSGFRWEWRGGGGTSDGEGAVLVRVTGFPYVH